eukprot:scaffold3785_cov165-Amphora_coffeaeformis.AAC.5
MPRVVVRSATVRRRWWLRRRSSEVIGLCLVALYLMICARFWWLDLSKEDHHALIVPGSFTNSQKEAFRDDDDPPLWQRMATESIFLPNNNNNKDRTGNHVLYVGNFGLGHRLSKLVSAYHLACQDDLCPWLQEFRVDWGSCGDGDDDTAANNNNTHEDVFSYLFGSNRLRILCNKNVTETASHSSPKTLLIRNDVQGYYAAQSYKNARIPLLRKALQSPDHVWNQKMDWDWAFFGQLVRGFRTRHGAALDAFQWQHKWDQHYVVGLHLRAGNGEKDHFVQADRGVTNLTDWCQAVTSTLRCALAQQQPKVPILVFVSTDTTDLIPVVKAALDDIPVVVFPQARLPSQEGVSYQKWTEGDQCYDGWKSAMTDMTLLALSNLVVAATRSTFTQILPLSQVLPGPRKKNQNDDDDSKYKFCEVGENGKVMTCFGDRQSWFLRQGGESTWRSSKTGQCEAVVPGPMKRSEKLPADHLRIVHKVMVHLPDVPEDSLRKDAITFLTTPNSTESRFYYGPIFSRKYRGGQNKVFRSEWTWIGAVAVGLSVRLEIWYPQNCTAGTGERK